MNEWKPEAITHTNFLLENMISAYNRIKQTQIELSPADSILVRKIFEDEVRRFEINSINVEREEKERWSISYYTAKEFFRKYILQKSTATDFV